MADEARIRTWREGRLAWIEIHRPDRLNALDSPALRELTGALRRAGEDPDVGVVLLTGAGERAFCAGADLGEMSGADAEGVRGLIELGKEAARLIEELPQPVIAVVNGYALGGGCELCLACDLVCAVKEAQFGLPEVDLAVLPGWGGTQRLERRIGYGRARDMLLTGRHVPAQEALQWGLCDRVFLPSLLRIEASLLAARIAEKAPEALAAVKQALRHGTEAAPDAGLARETELFLELFDRPARAEAMARFRR